MVSAEFVSVQKKWEASALAADPMEKANLAPTLGECLEAQYPGQKSFHDHVLRGIAANARAWGVVKDSTTNGVDVADLQNVRVVSRADRAPVIRNVDAKFRKLLDMQGRARKVTDPIFKINERDIINNVAPIVSLDSPTLQPMIQSQYLGRTNTMTAFAQQVGVSILASEVSSQQGQIDVKADQIDDAHKRIYKATSAVCLANVEVTSDLPGIPGQMGGYITRSTTSGNTIAVSGNFTESLLNSGYKQIRSRLGSGRKLVLFTTQGQISIIDNLMIQRYPGENSLAYFATQDMGKRMQDFDLSPDVVYKLRPGTFIPVISDDQLPAGFSILFVLEDQIYPRLARFLMFGQEGPYDLVRPEKTLFEIVYSFDYVSLDDPVQPSRVVYTGVNA